jgi:hypothetical protein
MAKKRPRKSAQGGERDRLIGRRRSRLPVILLTVVTALASLALIIAGILNFAAPR